MRGFGITHRNMGGRGVGCVGDVAPSQLMANVSCVVVVEALPVWKEGFFLLRDILVMCFVEVSIDH